MELNDLPDEILLLIFKKLSSTDVLYSFIDVNMRFDKLVHDSTITNHVSMTKLDSDNLVCSLNNEVLDRFCSRILPKIHHAITWLDVEFSSMKHVLLCTNYPNLYGLTIHNIEADAVSDLFNGQIGFTRIFQERITSLVIDGICRKNTFVENYTKANIFALILNTFAELKCFHYKPSVVYAPLFQASSTVSSSTLLELHIETDVFADCVNILDGRFQSLQRLYVNIYRIVSSQVFHNEKQIDKLKVFSLQSVQYTDQYYELVIPLIRRMINLEELDLHVRVYCESRFIDGYDLRNNITNNLSQLNRFIFNVRTRIPLNDQTHLLSKEECELSFKDFPNRNVIACIDYFFDRKEGQCLVYSYPYQVKYYEYITNNFRDEIFTYVREVSLYDDYPFEHEFFMKISKCFPFMTHLAINNNKSQKMKFHERSEHNNEHLSVIRYPYIRVIDLFYAHDDYVEQFLMDVKTCLPMQVNFLTYFSSLERVTHNFTRDVTRANCTKISSVHVAHFVSDVKQLREYFPKSKLYC